MAAFLKIYSDATHLSEVVHTTNLATTIIGSQAVGTSSLVVGSTANMPPQGVIDIIDGVNGNETLAYTGILDATHLTLAATTAFLHTGGQVVNQWYYLLAVGDQTLGIINDGTMASPSSPTNVGTWYIYNTGNQPATNILLATASSSPSTANGFSDTLLSITSSSSGYDASVSPSNLAAGATPIQFFVVAEIASGQSSITNPQYCLINLTYQSI